MFCSAVLFILVFRDFSEICTRRSIKIFFEKPRKVVDRTKAKHICDLADRVLVFTDQFLALLKFDIEQIILRRCIQMSLEQRLKRRAGYVKFVADLFNSDRFGDSFIHICKDFREQIVPGELAVTQQSFEMYSFVELHEQKQCLLKIACHKSSCIIRMFETLYKKFPQDLLHLAGAVECVIQNMQGSALIDFKYGCKIGCRRGYINMGGICMINDQIVSLKRMFSGR